MHRTGWLLVGIAFVAGGCDGTDPPGPGPDEQPEILSIETPTPTIVGSLLRVTGVGFDAVVGGGQLRLAAGGDFMTLPPGPAGQPGELFFSVTTRAVDTLGPGNHTVDAVLEGGLRDSEPYPFTITIAVDLPVSLVEGPTGIVHRNDMALLRGDGFLAPDEGTLTARFLGSFTPDGGSSTLLDVSLPVLPAERYARDRAVVRLSTAIGGVAPGVFDGTIQLESLPFGPSATRSSEVPARLQFVPPELYYVDPAIVSLEQVISVRGAGFLGGAEEPDEATVVRLAGTFTPLGGSPTPFGPEELVLEYVSGNEMRGVLRGVALGEQLVSDLFGAARGTFTGNATPVVIKGTTEVSGAAVAFELTLGPVRQVVYLHFLPGFYDSLGHFGLAASAGEIEYRVAARMSEIYRDYNVDIRLEVPTDFSPNGYATLEIGGPDPNGIGLFGYDNTPGKDFNNVRLYDRIGGTNALTQQDMFPGYGGVFVESFLYFSSHPDLPGGSASGAPDPDPLFDEVFDPIRARPATLGEVLAEEGRIDAVQRALSGLASLVGETAAHELGHSLGLAQPGVPMAYHNRFDGDGCIMDSGGARPLGERLQEPGFGTTHFCHDAPGYLESILGR